MEIIRASVMGFCMGVRRAVEMAEKVSENHKNSKVPMFTLGPLIHNPAVMEMLEKKGIKVLEPENFDCMEKGSPVIIRAHGADPNLVLDLEKKGSVIIDATCPRVKGSQNLVQTWSKKGYSVIIAGDKNHGEVTGINGYFSKDSGGKFFVVQSVDEAEKLCIPQKSVLLAQTTFSLKNFEDIKKVLSEKNPDLKIFDTICTATMERQRSLMALEKQTEGILVIGGKNSANTRRLFESAEKLFPKSALIENPDEIPESFFALKKVAITAGASTPDWIIDLIVGRLEKNAVSRD